MFGYFKSSMYPLRSYSYRSLLLRVLCDDWFPSLFTGHRFPYGESTPNVTTSVGWGSYTERGHYETSDLELLSSDSKSDLSRPLNRCTPDFSVPSLPLSLPVPRTRPFFPLSSHHPPLFCLVGSSPDPHDHIDSLGGYCHSQ